MKTEFSDLQSKLTYEFEAYGGHSKLAQKYDKNRVATIIEVNNGFRHKDSSARAKIVYLSDPRPGGLTVQSIINGSLQEVHTNVNLQGKNYPTDSDLMWYVSQAQRVFDENAQDVLEDRERLFSKHDLSKLATDQLLQQTPIANYRRLQESVQSYRRKLQELKS